ncbi:MAG: type VI secretion system ImpA family N-terminal domain-containing protein [Pseudomonadota bacterium]
MNQLEAPIPGDLPFGIYLKGDRATYRGLRNAFNASQAAWRSYSETPESLQDEELARANATAWATLSAACEKCLTETSKDLEILSWFVAAQLHGPKALPNTAEAMGVLSKLVDTSIGDIHPAPPPEKLKGETEEARSAEVAELRLRPFIQLFGEVERSGLIHAPVTNLALLGEITYGRALLAEKDGALDALRAEAAEALGSDLENFRHNVEALQQLDRLTSSLDSAAKRYANEHQQTPPLIGYGTRLVSDVLRICRLLVEGLGFAWPGQEDLAEATSDGLDTEGRGAEATRTHGQKSGGFGSGAEVANRQEALLAIAQLARYFRQSEPHSPICLLLDRAVRWGNLGAAELYREILTDGSVGMSQMALMTGLESEGYADGFGRRGARPTGGVEHPKLESHSAVLPTSSKSDPENTQPRTKMATTAAGASSDTVQKADADPPVSPDTDLPMEDFTW